MKTIYDSKPEANPVVDLPEKAHPGMPHTTFPIRKFIRAGRCEQVSALPDDASGFSYATPSLFIHLDNRSDEGKCPFTIVLTEADAKALSMRLMMALAEKPRA